MSAVDLDPEERAAALRARRSDPAFRAAVAERRTSIESACLRRQREYEAQQDAAAVAYLERMALRAPAAAVDRVIREAEVAMSDMYGMGAEAVDVEHDSVIAAVTNMLCSRRTSIRWGIAAEVLRCELGWSYEETHEWLKTVR